MGKKKKGGGKPAGGLGGGEGKLAKSGDKGLMISQKGTPRPSAGSTDEPDSDDEIKSEVSHLSLDDDMESVAGEEGELPEGEGEVTEDAEQILEDKIGGCLENVTHKNSSVRLAALKNLQSLLAHYYVPEIVEKWKLTIGDAAERSVKKGNVQEAKIGVKITALLALQLGVDVSELITKLVSIIRPQCADASLTLDYRAECCITLGLCNFVAVDEAEPLFQSLQTLRSVWQSIKTGNSPAEIQALFVASVGAWGLLCAQMPGRRLDVIFNTDLPKMCNYFDSNQVEIRIGTGETLSLLYELGTEMDDNFRPPNHQQTLDMLSMLSTDSLKYRAKKDRRVQRSSFRQIYTAIKENEAPVLTIKFGGGESLVLDTWVRKSFYDVSCSVLRSGINSHLKKNLMLREIFGLGQPISGNLLKQMSKTERQAVQDTVSKARTLHRGKQRDKRVANFDNS